MLYKTFRWLFYLTTKAYFRSIYVQGKESIPESDTPVIFAANHPSSFMDPILLAVNLNRIIFFLVRGDLFKNKVLKRLFNKLHMIPVYKSDLSPGQVSQNEIIFEKCHDHLAKNNTIMIFPEGTSKTERRLRPIKTGVARIALGAEEKQDFSLGLTIVPVGLNYSNPHYFKSDVFVNIGEPILVSEYKDVYQKDARDGVVQLTERVKVELEKRIVIIEDERLEKIIKQIEILYRSKLRDESKLEEKATQDFYLSQDIVKAVEYFAQKSPEVLKEFEHKITYYLKTLKDLKIRDTQVRSSSISLEVIGKIVYFIIGFPVFLFGFITNVIPFKLSEFIAKKILIRDDFVGAIKMAVGMLIFLIMYIIQSTVFGSFTSLFWGIVFCISLYPAGLFTVSYIKTYYKVRGTVKYLKLFMQKSDLVTKLKSTRQELVDELENRKNEYLDQRDS
ncbi:lysophospholipid acyltransferase family protein [Bacteroidia bacterium]|nr:lysophospholipid acyltransferase family protein [Bacteroidia bacterium]MDB4107354.1 lysophospholipid acyltransferase family protein [Bacteroidia bacterium]MDB9883100.1 lysophospholipid acyltransferase family protein [Bacteroidia bacterium]MDC1395513.1 lysophospholipid acyltransferase family protein [Bacteroidia bacterium]